VNHYRVVAILQIIFLGSTCSALIYLFTQIHVFFILGYLDLIHPGFFSMESVAALFHYLPFVYLGMLLNHQERLRWKDRFSPHGLFLILMGLSLPVNLELIFTVILRLPFLLNTLLSYAVVGTALGSLVMAEYLPGTPDQKHQQKLLVRLELAMIVVIPVILGFLGAFQFQLIDKLVSATGASFSLLATMLPNSVLYVVHSGILLYMIHIVEPKQIVVEEQELQYPMIQE